MSNPILHSQEPNLCQTCQLQPLPQSTQYLPFLAIEALLLFINVKFSIIALCLGYSFSKTVWICPLCKRDISINKQSQNTNNHIIIRIGDCMMLIGKNKFRILALGVIGALMYFYVHEPQYKPNVPIDQTWRNIVMNSGYQAHLQNSVRANFLYEQYEKMGEWTLEGIYIDEEKLGRSDETIIKIKMNPSQFKDPSMQDFRVIAKKQSLDLKEGDEVRMYGKWSGRIHHLMLFAVSRMEKTGRTVGLSEVDNFGKGIRRDTD